MSKLPIFFRILGIAVFLGQAALAFCSEADRQPYLEVVKANPKDMTAHLKLGISYMNDRMYDEASEEFKKCVQLDSNNEQAKELFESSQGISAYLQHNFSNAADHFQKALRINSQSPNANELLADCYVQLKQFDKAETVLKNYSAAFPQDKEIQAKAGEGLGKIYIGRGDYENAAKILSQVSAGSPGNQAAHQNLGYAYFQMKKYAEAARAWEKSLSLRKDASIFKYIGFAYYNLGDFNRAIDSYLRSIKMESSKDPKDQDIDSLDETYYDLAIAYNDNSLYDQAAEAFGQAFKVNPKDSNAALGRAQAIEMAINAHMEKASRFLLENRYSEAIGEWKMVQKFQPDNQQAMGFIADAQSKLEVEVEKHFKAGKSLANAGKSGLALNEWNLGLQMDPENARLQKAVRSLEIRKKDKVTALLKEGDTLLSEKDYSGAVDAYARASKADPKNKKAKTMLAKIRNQRNTETKGAYGKALQHYGGGNGDLKSALKWILQAKEIDPKDEKVKSLFFKIQMGISVKVKTLAEEGIAAFNKNDKKNAQEKFSEVLKLKPGDETANEYMKKMTGQQSHAKADAEKVKALYYEGVNLYINGKIHEAIDKWEECKLQDPGNVNVLNNIEKARAKLKSIQKLSGS